MRVLHVDSGREYRGGQDQVRLLTRELEREAGVEQHLVTKRGSELARRVDGGAVTVRGVPWAFGLDPRASWRIAVEALAWPPDVIHAHNAHAVTLSVWARRFLRLTGQAPAFVATRRVVFPVRRRSALHLADAVVAVSEAARATLIAGGFPPAEVTVVHDGVDPDEVRRASAPPLDIRTTLRLPRDTPLAVNIAALEPAKDQGTLVRAAAIARRLHPALHWVVGGDGPQRAALSAEIGRLGVGDRVNLVGHVERPDALLSESQVLVMSSRAEGLGSIVLHALALGKPVVATAAGGLPEVVPPEWVVPVGDAEALARTVVRAVEHPSPFPLPRQFTAAAMAAGVLAVYRSLV
ncbi:MAG TPA: glycosyltransferase [Gemmatimonadales bacterium]|nr:glycosyltransferase [Gemmatimonadales bacterium]